MTPAGAKVGQVIMTAIEGTTAEEAVARAAGDALAQAAGDAWHPLAGPDPVGGVVLFGGNIEGRAGLANLTAGLRRVARDPDLLIAIDQEGGAVARLGEAEGFTAFPGNMALGAVQEGPGAAQGAASGAALGDGLGAGPAMARAAARAMAGELAWAGVSLDFAPVLDVNSNPNNPVIGVRSFGEDPGRVAELGAAATLGFLEGGVAPVGKHFPGHGDTDLDSHLALPTVACGLEDLRRVDLVPFEMAIAAGLPAIMTAHVAVTAVDPDGLPATLSRGVLTGLARERLGFRGALITDALEMKAIAEKWGPGEAAVAALAAGADIVLVCRPGLEREVRRAILAALASGRLAPVRLDEAAGRVASLKKAASTARGRARARGWSEPASADNKSLAARIAASALTLVRDRDGLLGASRHSLLSAGRHSLLAAGRGGLAPGGSASALAGRFFVVAPRGHVAGELAAALRGAEPGLRVDVAEYAEPPEEAEIGAIRSRLAPGPDEPGLVVLATRFPCGVPADPGARRSFHGLARALLTAGPPGVWLSLGAPYELSLFPEAPAFLAAYSDGRASLEAAARALLGRLTPRGRLPVTIPGFRPDRGPV